MLSRWWRGSLRKMRTVTKLCVDSSRFLLPTTLLKSPHMGACVTCPKLILNRLQLFCVTLRSRSHGPSPARTPPRSRPAGASGGSCVCPGPGAAPRGCRVFAFHPMSRILCGAWKSHAQVITPEVIPGPCLAAEWARAKVSSQGVAGPETSAGQPCCQLGV